MKDIGIGTSTGTNSHLYRNVAVINGILKYCYAIVTAPVLVLSPYSDHEAVLEVGVLDDDD